MAELWCENCNTWNEMRVQRSPLKGFVCPNCGWLNQEKKGCPRCHWYPRFEKGTLARRGPFQKVDKKDVTFFWGIEERYYVFEEFNLCPKHGEFRACIPADWYKEMPPIFDFRVIKNEDDIFAQIPFEIVKHPSIKITVEEWAIFDAASWFYNECVYRFLDPSGLVERSYFPMVDTNSQLQTYFGHQMYDKLKDGFPSEMQSLIYDWWHTSLAANKNWLTHSNAKDFGFPPIFPAPEISDLNFDVWIYRYFLIQILITLSSYKIRFDKKKLSSAADQDDLVFFEKVTRFANKIRAFLPNDLSHSSEVNPLSVKEQFPGFLKIFEIPKSRYLKYHFELYQYVVERQFNSVEEKWKNKKLDDYLNFSS
jgi:hypothetical protein